jgi:hypothetical protein
LREAVELFFETADASEIERRLVSEVYITRLNVARGRLCVLSGRDVCAILAKQGL